ncbi:unnamed protein product, partial [marine sediment metagenome]
MTNEKLLLDDLGNYTSTEEHSLKKRESYLVSRISKKDSRAHKRIGYTR